jgi:hypothetical protein
MHARLAFLISALVISILMVWHFQRTRYANAPFPSSGEMTSAFSVTGPTHASYDRGATTVKAHNMLLREGPNFRIYLRCAARADDAYLQ